MPLPPSAADWTRFKRLSASRLSVPYNLIYKLDITNVRSPGACVTGCQSRAGIRRDQDFTVGTGRTRREASKWIEHVAANRSDLVTVRAHPASNGFGDFGRQQFRTQLCESGVQCVTSILRPRIGILRSAVYQHSRIL